MAKKKKKSNSISLNFKDVKTFKTPPEDSYLVRVEGAELTTSSNDNEMISWEFEIAAGKYEGSKLFYNTNTGKDSLWKLREVLEALGHEVPDGKLDLDLEELIGCECGVVVYHEVYDGKNRAKIADFLAADEVDPEESDEDDEEEEEKPKSKKSKSSKKSKKEEPEDEDEEEDDEDLDVSSMDEDELEELISDRGLDVDLDDYSTIKKKRKAVQEAMESEEEDEDDEEDEDEDSDETKYSEDQIKEMSQEDLEELNDDLELGIEDLDEMTKKTARRNVIKALKKKGLFEE